MLYKFYKKTGFTVIELLVVIVIITVISAVMVINFRKGEGGNKLQRSAQQIVQSIRKAQNMAISSIEYEGEVSGYGVHFERQTMPNFYYLFFDKSGDNRYNAEPKIETINLEKGILIESLSTGNQLDIVFNPPEPLTVFDDNPSIQGVTIIIKKEGATCPSESCRSINVKKAGWTTVE